MAEKRVSVRLAAVGGRQVRAELEGVGEAGARGFGRLSREMEAANARLAGFARRISLATSAAVAAAVPAMGAIANATIRAAAVTRELAQVANAPPEAFQRWVGAAQSVGIEEEKLADILKDVNDRIGDFIATGGGEMKDFFENVAPKVGVTAEQFRRLSGPEALQLYVASLEKAGVSQQEMTFYLEAMANDVTRLLPLLRDGGAEMERLGARAEELGVVMDARTLETLRQAQTALLGVGQVFEGMRNQLGAALAPKVTALAEGFVQLASSGGIVHRAFHALLDNLGRLGTYAATFATFLAGRWVAGMAAAALSVRGLATALAVLRGALIRTGIGLAVVAAGELVYQFSRLVAGAGGFGQAMGLLADVGRAAFSEIGTLGKALAASLGWAAASIARAFVEGFAWIGRKWAAFCNWMLTPFNAVMAALGQDFRLQAVSPIEGLTGEVSGWLGEKAAEMNAAAGEALAGATRTRGAVAALGAALKGPQDVQGAPAPMPPSIDLGRTAAAADNVSTALDAAGKAGGAAGKAIKEGADTATEALEAAAEATHWEATLEKLRDYATTARDVGAEVGETLVGAFRGAEDAVANFVTQGKLSFSGMVTSMIGDLARLAARKFILGPLSNALNGVLGVLGGGVRGGNAPLGPFHTPLTFASLAGPSFEGGGHTGFGPRIGGLDGRGGYLAMVHPRERIIDETRGAWRGAPEPAPVIVNIQARDVESFRRSRTQVAAEIARAVQMGRRGL